MTDETQPNRPENLAEIGKSARFSELIESLHEVINLFDVWGDTRPYTWQERAPMLDRARAAIAKAEAAPKPMITITVEGGCVQDVDLHGLDADYEIIDFDNLDAEGVP